jgi:rhodanese-related sulfurtransferase
MQEIIDTLKNADPESTSYPYWMILDPRQTLRIDPHYLASMITGPFFSREDAESYLKQTSYNFSKNAVVYCASGYYSKKYKKFYQSIFPDKITKI